MLVYWEGNLFASHFFNESFVCVFQRLEIKVISLCRSQLSFMQGFQPDAATICPHTQKLQFPVNRRGISFSAVLLSSPPTDSACEEELIRNSWWFTDQKGTDMRTQIIAWCRASCNCYKQLWQIDKAHERNSVLGPSEVAQSSKVVGSRSVPWRLAQRLMWGIQNPRQTKILLLDNLHLKQINRRSCLPKNHQKATWNPSTRAPVGSKEWTFHPCPGGVNTSWETAIWISPPRSFILMWNVSSKQPKKWRLFCLTWSSRKKPKAWNGMHHASSWASCNFPTNRMVSRLHFHFFSLHDLEGVSGFFWSLPNAQRHDSWISPEGNGFDGLKDQEKQLPSLLFRFE